MRLVFTLSLLALATLQSAYAACIKPGVSQFDPAIYYAPAQEKSGDELKSALNSIIKGHASHSYTCVWDILREADEDPQNANNVIGFYTRRPIPKSRRDQGGNDMDAWNREHIWAKSHGFPSKSQHAYTDAHHVRATDKSVNADRSNNDFTNGGTVDDECLECREGNGTWEAPDIVKGDLARMMFYMVVRYEGNDNSNTPDLELVDRKTNIGERFFGKLCSLVEWHMQDPVSNEERIRNDTIYSWQGNRNPFIDNPQWVASIWGDECGMPGTTKEILLDKLERLESELNELRLLIEESL